MFRKLRENKTWKTQNPGRLCKSGGRRGGNCLLSPPFPEMHLTKSTIIQCQTSHGTPPISQVYSVQASETPTFQSPLFTKEKVNIPSWTFAVLFKIIHSKSIGSYLLYAHCLHGALNNWHWHPSQKNPCLFLLPIKAY